MVDSPFSERGCWREDASNQQPATSFQFPTLWVTMGGGGDSQLERRRPNRIGATLLPRDVSKMLTPERITRLRGYLLEEQASLRQELVSLEDSVQEANVGLGNHMAEDATAAFDQATAVSLRRAILLFVQETGRRMIRGMLSCWRGCCVLVN